MIRVTHSESSWPHLTAWCCRTGSAGRRDQVDRLRHGVRAVAAAGLLDALDVPQEQRLAVLIEATVRHPERSLRHAVGDVAHRDHLAVGVDDHREQHTLQLDGRQVIGQLGGVERLGEQLLQRRPHAEHDLHRAADQPPVVGVLGRELAVLLAEHAEIALGREAADHLRHLRQSAVHPGGEGTRVTRGVGEYCGLLHLEKLLRSSPGLRTMRRGLLHSSIRSMHQSTPHLTD